MKLRLFLETPDQAEALRFVASGEHSRWHCLQPGQSTPVYDDGTMDIALSFDQAKAFWEISRVCIYVGNLRWYI